MKQVGFKAGMKERGSYIRMRRQEAMLNVPHFGGGSADG